MLFRSAECAASALHCWICDEPIGYSLAWPDREAFEADHILSVKSHPERALDPSNVAPSHAKCNRSRGATQTQQLADAKRREVFLLRQLELAQSELTELRSQFGEFQQWKSRQLALVS